LALLSLQKTRGFVQNVFYPKNIAPELANFLSPEFVRRMTELKRKREVEEEVGEEAMEPAEGRTPRRPRLEIELEEEEVLFLPEEVSEVAPEEETIEFPHEEPPPLPMPMEEEEISMAAPGMCLLRSIELEISRVTNKFPLQNHRLQPPCFHRRGHRQLRLRLKFHK
jgi:hypothetical protein